MESHRRLERPVRTRAAGQHAGRLRALRGTIEEIAKAEKINPSYVSRGLLLTLFEPAIVESILDGRQPAEMTLAVLMEPFLVGWNAQRKTLPRFT